MMVLFVCLFDMLGQCWCLGGQAGRLPAANGKTLISSDAALAVETIERN
jgi:hypothetical protein